MNPIFYSYQQPSDSTTHLHARDNSQRPIKPLTQTSLGCGRKLERLRVTRAVTKGTCKLHTNSDEVRVNPGPWCCGATVLPLSLFHLGSCFTTSVTWMPRTWYLNLQTHLLQRTCPINHSPQTVGYSKCIQISFYSCPWYPILTNWLLVSNAFYGKWH